MQSTVTARSNPPSIGSLLPRLAVAWLITGLSDGTFASVNSLVNGSTPTRLFQGVASVLLGPEALNGGTTTALIGLLMHFGVALGWSIVFLILATRVSPIQTQLAAPYGFLKIAALYGLLIWLIMSLLVIPALTHRPPAFTPRWWVQLIGHFPFVGIPIVGVIGGLYRRR